MFDFLSKVFFSRRATESRGAVSAGGASASGLAMPSDDYYSEESGEKTGGIVKVLKKGPAMRVIFFYPGEEGTYVDNADVILYENGIIHIKSNQEETTTHLQNCEILWRFETEADDRASKVRLLKPKSSSRDEDKSPPDRSPEA